MKAILMLAGACASMVFLVGCETIPPGAEHGPSGTMAYHIIIEASDPGATIIANGADIGKTPVTLKIFGNPDGTFHDFGSRYYVIQALPVVTNQFAQTRVFPTRHRGSSDRMIPHQLHFDMSKPAPVEPQVYVNPGYPPPGYYYGPRFYIGPPFYGPWPGPGPRGRW